MSSAFQYQINTDLGIDYRDAGPWRCYHLEVEGSTLSELIFHTVIAEVDQDGGELDCYGIEDASDEVREAAYSTIEMTIKRGKENESNRTQ